MSVELRDRTFAPSQEYPSLIDGRFFSRREEPTGLAYGPEITAVFVTILPPDVGFRSSSSWTSNFCNVRLHTDWRDPAAMPLGFFPGEEEELIWEVRNSYPEIDRQTPLLALARPGVQSGFRAAQLPRVITTSLESDPFALASFRAELDRIIELARQDPRLMAALREAIGDQAATGQEPMVAPAQAPAAAEEIIERPWQRGLRHIKNMAELTDGELGHLFGVSRHNVQAWLNQGQGMRLRRQQHLSALTSVIEDAFERAGRNPRSVRYVLFAETSNDGKRPVDYLRDQKYRVARGLLVTAFSPKIPDTSPRPFLEEYQLILSVEERNAALEALSPTPRFD